MRRNSTKETMTGNQLRRARKRLRMTQSELAEASGYSTLHISQMENNRRTVSARIAATVALLSERNSSTKSRNKRK